MRCLWRRSLQANRWNTFNHPFPLIPPSRPGPIASLKCMAASRWQSSTPVRVGEQSAGRRSRSARWHALWWSGAWRCWATMVRVKCSVGKLIALMRRARLFVGGDTGPMHLAAALRVPVVALFGPTRPERNGPFGTPSVVLRSPESVYNTTHTDRRDEGLVSIEPQAVIQAAERLLGEQHG